MTKRDAETETLTVAEMDLLSAIVTKHHDKINSFTHATVRGALGAVAAEAFADGQARGRAEWPEWQPIETAPKDGTEILLGWFDLGSAYRVRHLGYWNDLHNRWADGSGRRWRVPTHWMPLPGNPDSAALRARDRT